jgi:hypothetical protein
VHPANVTAEQTRTGAQGREIRVAIEMAERYLPADRCAEITASARRAAFERCLERLRLPVLAGNTAGAMRLLIEMLRIDRTPPSLEALFAWLATAMAEPLWRPIAESVPPSRSDERGRVGRPCQCAFDRLQTRTAETARSAMVAHLLADRPQMRSRHADSSMTVDHNSCRQIRDEGIAYSAGQRSRCPKAAAGVADNKGEQSNENSQASGCRARGRRICLLCRIPHLPMSI